MKIAIFCLKLRPRLRTSAFKVCMKYFEHPARISSYVIPFYVFRQVICLAILFVSKVELNGLALFSLKFHLSYSASYVKHGYNFYTSKHSFLKTVCRLCIVKISVSRLCYVGKVLQGCAVSYYLQLPEKLKQQYSTPYNVDKILQESNVS